MFNNKRNELLDIVSGYEKLNVYKKQKIVPDSTINKRSCLKNGIMSSDVEQEQKYTMPSWHPTPEEIYELTKVQFFQ